jgi:hypothetical protein
LLGHADDAHAAFANLLQELAGANLGTGFFADGLVEGGGSNLRDRLFQELACTKVVVSELV